MSLISKSIATIAVANITVICMLVGTVVANSLINSEEMAFSLVGLSTYAVMAAGVLLAGTFLFKLWSPKS